MGAWGKPWGQETKWSIPEYCTFCLQPTTAKTHYLLSVTDIIHLPTFSVSNFHITWLRCLNLELVLQGSSTAVLSYAMTFTTGLKWAEIPRSYSRSRKLLAMPLYRANGTVSPWLGPVDVSLMQGRKGKFTKRTGVMLLLWTVGIRKDVTFCSQLKLYDLL